MQITITEAKSQFAELIRRAEAGETVVLTRHGRPVVRMTAEPAAPVIPLIGALRGRITIADDFDDLPASLNPS